MFIILFLLYVCAVFGVGADITPKIAAGGLHHKTAAPFPSHGHRVRMVNATIARNDSADALVEQAMIVLREANKYQVQNPRFNKREFPAPGERYANSSRPVSLLGRQHANATTPASLLGEPIAKRDNSSSFADGYFIPTELATAAKLVAESVNHDSVVTGDAEATEEELKAQFWGPRQDTITPNASVSAPMMESPVPLDLQKREDDPYWMESVDMNGASPYAEGSYKIFRNVRDYGAKGDGKTDDTEAINRAITDGGRCGRECGASMAKPAVIYFPSGTYLVSRSIVQYYNTQFIGNPENRPKMLAATSFTGLGLFSTNVYIDGGNGAEWYIPQNNFQRSIRNFVIDISNADPDAYVCGIHWQVAQATDLQNIAFYMKPGTTQQGIFMENGSGGFMSDLAYFGNQQFTTRKLIFYNCKTAVQVHWDWAWTMQGITVIGGPNAKAGIVITGGAGGPGSTGQGVGSFILLDSSIGNVPTGIETSLLQENSTSMLIQNTKFLNTQAAVVDKVRGQTLIAGGKSQTVASWGFGRMVNGKSGQSDFTNGADIPTANRTESLIRGSDGWYFSREAPSYMSVSGGSFLNIKSWGARGDGKTDDTSIINQVLQYAAASSLVVFFPYGDYVVSDTVRVPLGSRIVGQAWSQIRATGNKFADEFAPKTVIQVGQPGDVGVVEISDMLFTTSAGSAGAKVVEWNVREGVQGSAAMWNTPVRVGGTVGTGLQTRDCPKKTGSVNRKCIAAGLLFHLTSSASAYLENIWMWTADHDLDVSDQTQIDIYTGRGMLVESQAPTWLWGTASEHNVLYQYQLVNAKNIFMSMIQTETPYYQPVPAAPAPFTPGIFTSDPNFDNCGSKRQCAMAWALRVIDSSSIFIYSAGLYSWFYDYSQDCVARENCQEAAVQIEQSRGIWLYSLATKAVVQMVSPFGSKPTIAAENQNGFLSSILAWLEGSTDISGRRYDGWSVVRRGSLDEAGVSKRCVEAMYQAIKCDDSAQWLLRTRYATVIKNATLHQLICDPGCQQSVNYTLSSVESACRDTPNLQPGVPLKGFVQTVADKWQQFCLRDKSTAKFCNEILLGFSSTDKMEDLPKDQLCSYCNLQRWSLMQKSSFSGYDTDEVKKQWEYTAKACNKPDAAFEPSPGGFKINSTDSTVHVCASGNKYKTQSGDTCDSIAVSQKVSAASLYWINSKVLDCAKISAGTELCLPLPCATLHSVKPEESCFNISTAAALSGQLLLDWNLAVDDNCTNLHDGTWGSTLCVGMAKIELPKTNGTVSLDPWVGGNGVGGNNVPAPSGSVVADSTTTDCGGWHTHVAGTPCTQICMKYNLLFPTFLAANPSLMQASCDGDLIPGRTYCVHPSGSWNKTTVSNPYANRTLAATLVHDNFYTGKMDNWTVHQGSFSAATRALVAGGPGRNLASLAVSRNFTDFTFEADVSFPPGSSVRAGLVFRADGLAKDSKASPAGYVVYVNRDGGLGMARVSDLQASRAAADDPVVLQQAKVSAAPDGGGTVTLHVMVRAEGSSIKVFVDDMAKPRLDVRDGAYRKGLSGVVAEGEGAGASFDNIRIAPLAKDALSLYFADGTTKGLQVVDGDWSASSKALVARSSGGGKVMVEGTGRFQNVSIEADMALPDRSNANAGLVLGVGSFGPGINDIAGLYVGIDASGYTHIYEVAGGQWKLLTWTRIRVDHDELFHVMVRAAERRVTVWYQDMAVPVMNVTLDHDLPVGSVGARVWWTGATYKNFNIHTL